VCALVLSLWGCHQSFYVNCLWPESTFIESSKKYFSLTNPAEAKVPLTLAKFAALLSDKKTSTFDIAVYDSYLRWFLGLCGNLKEKFYLSNRCPRNKDKLCDVSCVFATTASRVWMQLKVQCRDENQSISN